MPGYTYVAVNEKGKEKIWPFEGELRTHGAADSSGCPVYRISRRRQCGI